MSDLWTMLDDRPPVGCEAVQDLYSWSLNYDAGKGPFVLFLDLIGWTDEAYGEPMYDLSTASLGYVELSYLAAALAAYSDLPHDVRAYVEALMEAEARA